MPTAVTRILLFEAVLFGVQLLAATIMLAIMWRNIVIFRRIRMLWLTICTQGYAMRGYPLHLLLLRAAEIAEKKAERRDGN